jgi:hypothetical protein
MSSSDNSKLLATALGAAVAGAAIGITAMKLTSKTAAAAAPSQGRDAMGNSSIRNSYIFEDPSSTNNKTVVFPHNHEERMRRKMTARAIVEEDNFVPRKSVTVRVPATSANMGPGCK